MSSKKAQKSKRIVIEKISPLINGGEFPIKRVKGERVVVRAAVFADGHDEVCAVLLHRRCDEPEWHETRMISLGNDLWVSSFLIEEEKNYLYSVRGYIHEFATWRHDLQKRIEAGQDVTVDLKIGAQLLEDTASRCNEEVALQLRAWGKQLTAPQTREKGLAAAMNQELFALMDTHLNKEKSVTFEQELLVVVDPALAQFSSWYEFFPRSWGAAPGQHGTFKDCERLFPEISRMGFNVIYLPPVHPIAKTFRKGKNNAVKCEPGDPGSPWAIGSEEGGHKAVHPQLGTLADFKDFVKKAREYNLSVALDIAFQCSMDHPYVKEHPDWFKWRPDGTIQYAENPPKKYQDVLPLNFDAEDVKNLWEEMKSIFIFWAKQGVRIFRVDNPHTKPFVFWDWVISEVKRQYPDTIFLAEAFTRPHLMYRLAKGGFTQSYTYFTWRNTKQEFMDYMNELTRTEIADFFRPNFWTNTPDILAEHLQRGGRPAFIMRVVLAATLSSNFGVYGPAFELCVAQAMPNSEEYLNSEKYEIKQWDWNKPGHIKDTLARLNAVRRENPALQMTRNIRFCAVYNEHLLAFYKATADFSNIILVVVNLDPHHTQAGNLHVPIDDFGLPKDRVYAVHDVLNDQKHSWQGAEVYIELNPQKTPAHIFRVSGTVRREPEVTFFM